MVSLFLLTLFATSLATLVFSQISRHSKIGHDLDSGVQKFHTQPTSRLGGLAIAIGLVTAWAGGSSVGSELASFLGSFLLASLFVFAGGLVEDLTHKVSPALRLLLALMSASYCYWYLGIAVFRTDVALVDALLALPGATYLVTLLVVAGFTHSMNIIDGFHGLASGIALIMVSGLAYIAWSSHDALLVQLCTLTFAAVLGFFVFNWPTGQVFLGDAGAYLLGFWIVGLGLLLVSRNPGVAPMAPVVVGILPLFETLFSMYRRRFVRKHSVNHADSLHLHTLVYRRLLLNPAVDVSHRRINAANAKVAVHFWLPSMVFAALACLFFGNTHAQLALIVAFGVLYVWLYKRVIRYNTPKWLMRRDTPRSSPSRI